MVKFLRRDASRSRLIILDSEPAARHRRPGLPIARSCILVRPVSARSGNLLARSGQEAFIRQALSWRVRSPARQSRRCRWALLVRAAPHVTTTPPPHPPALKTVVPERARSQFRGHHRLPRRINQAKTYTHRHGKEVASRHRWECSPQGLGLSPKRTRPEHKLSGCTALRLDDRISLPFAPPFGRWRLAC